MWKNHNFSQSKSKHKFLVPVFFISKNIKQFFFEITMIVLSHNVCIKCYQITFFTYFFFSRFSVVIWSSGFYNKVKPAAWASSTSADNLVRYFHWLVLGLKMNVDVPDFRVLQTLKSLIILLLRTIFMNRKIAKSEISWDPFNLKKFPHTA